MAEQAGVALAEVKRQAVIDHVLSAARTHVLTNGIDATMDELAEATGVSRRTLFRHFSSREKLLAAAFEAGMANYRLQLPSYRGDLTGWLRATCESAHRMNATIGPGFFDLASRPDLPPDLRDVEDRRRSAFREAMAEIAHTLWTASGRSGRTPRGIKVAVTAHLSPHFTAALMIDAGEPWNAAADLAYGAILAALERETRTASSH
ncbi:MAG: helix-turn-helix domain-containing protein [Mycobacterium sp.]